MYYPRSFLKFILLSFLLVSLPLVYALAELILSLDRLQTQGQQAVQEAAQGSRASRLLLEQSGTLERLVRQHIILDDAALLDDYARVRQDFRATIRQLGALPLRRQETAALDVLSASEARLYDLLRTQPRGAEATQRLADGYARLGDGSQAMLGATNELTERAIERLQDTAREGRQKWLYLALATAGIAVALAIVFAVLIARPIRQLDQAIRQMGTADFTHAIEVTGPADLRYLGQRLEWLRTRLHDLEEQQNRFLRHVSHELKTPLTAVREGAELLRDNVGGRLTTEQHDIVRIVRDNTLQLQKLIEDLLTYHQTRAMEPQALGPVSLPEVVGGVLREHKLAALARMISFDTRLPAGEIVGDAAKVRTIVDNLVSNAIKYSPRGGSIRVELSARDGIALLDVIDQGAGVDPQERQQIFDSFYQGRPPADGRSRAPGSASRSRASTRWRTAAGSKRWIAPTGVRRAVPAAAAAVRRGRAATPGRPRRGRSAQRDAMPPPRGRTMMRRATAGSCARALWLCRRRPRRLRDAAAGAGPAATGCTSTTRRRHRPRCRRRHRLRSSTLRPSRSSCRCRAPPRRRRLPAPPCPSPLRRVEQRPRRRRRRPTPRRPSRRRAGCGGAGPPAEPTDEQLMAAVVADLARYRGSGRRDAPRRTAVTQRLARQRNDANRIRLAVLYTMGPRAGGRPACAAAPRQRRPERTRARRRSSTLAACCRCRCRAGACRPRGAAEGRCRRPEARGAARNGAQPAARSRAQRRRGGGGGGGGGSGKLTGNLARRRWLQATSSWSMTIQTFSS